MQSRGLQSPPLPPHSSSFSHNVKQQQQHEDSAQHHPTLPAHGKNCGAPKHVQGLLGDMQVNITSGEGVSYIHTCKKHQKVCKDLCVNVTSIHFSISVHRRPGVLLAQLPLDVQDVLRRERE